MAPLTNKQIAEQLRTIADIGIVNYKQNDLLRLAADRLEKPGHRQTEKRATVLYTVWDNRTDQLIALDEPESTCLELMKISHAGFMAAIRRGSYRWKIEKRFADEEEPEE